MGGPGVVLEEDVFNGELGHAAKHNTVNDQVNWLTAELTSSYVRTGVIAPGVNGVVGDGSVSDRLAIQAILDNYEYVWVAQGTYLLDAAVLGRDDLTIEGPGRAAIFRSTANPASGGAGVGHRLFDFTGKTGFRLARFHCDMSPMTVFAAGVRCLWLDSSTSFDVDDVTYTTPGAGYAAINCSDYRIKRPIAEIVSTDGTPKHDGIFDQWAGCHDFEIDHPKVYGNGIGKYGVLVTGETTAGDDAPCYDFKIIKPKVYDVTQLGVLANGRGGVNHDFTIDDPEVDGAGLHGVGIADSIDWVLITPKTKNTGSNGVRVFSETATRGETGGRNGVIVSPVVSDANQLGSGSSVDGAAIAITDNSDGVVVVGPNVSGDDHTYAVAYGLATTHCDRVGGVLAAGTLGKIYNDPKGGSYQPVLTAVANATVGSPGPANMWTRDGDFITVRGRLTVTTGTAGVNAPVQVGIDLPVASDLASASTDLIGTGATQFGHSVAISADTVNNRAQLQFPAPTATALAYIIYYSLTYKVL